MASRNMDVSISGGASFARRPTHPNQRHPCEYERQIKSGDQRMERGHITCVCFWRLEPLRMSVFPPVPTSPILGLGLSLCLFVCVTHPSISLLVPWSSDLTIVDRLRKRSLSDSSSSSALTPLSVKASCPPSSGFPQLPLFLSRSSSLFYSVFSSCFFKDAFPCFYLLLLRSVSTSVGVATLWVRASATQVVDNFASGAGSKSPAIVEVRRTRLLQLLEPTLFLLSVLFFFSFFSARQNQTRSFFSLSFQSWTKEKESLNLLNQIFQLPFVLFPLSFPSSQLSVLKKICSSSFPPMLLIPSRLAGRSKTSRKVHLFCKKFVVTQATAH